jgi:hypothetical protein
MLDNSIPELSEFSSRATNRKYDSRNLKTNDLLANNFSIDNHPKLMLWKPKLTC